MYRSLRPLHRPTRSRFSPHTGPAVDALEARALLSHNVVDFMPLAAGDQWQYQGTLNGQAVNATLNASASGVISGFSATRLTTTLTPTGGGGATTDTRYYAHTPTGLRMLRQDVSEPSLNSTTLFGAGVRFLTPSVEDGDSVHFVKSFSGSSSDGRAWTGVFRGDMRVVGLENITTSVGSFEALRVSLTGSFSETGSTGWTATGSVAETRWLVRGVGAAHIDYSWSANYSDQAPHALRYNLGLVSSNRLGGITSEIVRGKGVDIAYGDTSPSAVDGTNYTGIDVNGGLKTRVFTITNTSSSTIGFAPGSQGFITISGSNASDFVVVRQPVQSLLPGRTTFFSVRFDPSTTGFRYATISFVTTGAGATPFQFAVRGTGILLGLIQVMGPQSQTIANGSSASAEAGTKFGSIAASGTRRIQRTFTIVNTGAGALLLTSPSRVVITGANASNFTVTLMPSATLAPGQSTVFKISFDPSGLGTRGAQVSILSNDRLNPVFTFAIEGIGI